MTAETIVSINPATGTEVEEVATATSYEELEEVCRSAAAAFVQLAERDRAFPGELLRTMADAMAARRADIVSLGVRETGLPRARLEGELTRTVYQARLFADVVDEGGHLEVTIDHAGDTPMGPRPDLRRMLVPTGPVAVFGASNFPLAFSVPGGDTMSALAAGCPVVVKAHDSHPALSVMMHGILSAAAYDAGAPAGTIGLVHGREAGARLVQHPAISAVGFTGSLDGGRALMRLIEQRQTPIPFFGELASLNPVVVTQAAAAARGTTIAEDLVLSLTGSGGQLCTKPGLVLVPQGPAGDALVNTAGNLIADRPAATLLNEGIRDGYEETSAELRRIPGFRVVAEGERPSGSGFAVAPRLLAVEARDLVGSQVGECFGPTTVIVRYAEADLAGIIVSLPGSLTATIHSEPSEDIRAIVRALLPKAGRLLFNGFPTGVSVSWAQHHGGPWPATNSQHTSVGTTAIRRFLRPVTWQSAPVEVLPHELHDAYTSIPRRVDGRLVVPSPAGQEDVR
ncbi:aldehyde dehydrogenase (NADP(+)) [Streptomyces acidicola]|uniref:Aldehyde dehydrogenase (NADP(+)) n=1 Tax=Streptomyces acidicola TaxID=2596892 RepID=A0A5N8WKM4_9ACTN|nr:aldehyde dehydrogenase (NADP(+)) [Streptomyces acidicola]MPY47777.1 aldehyde dehydrogenase (NADP(+)) [Streptomyces acidicola]